MKEHRDKNAATPLNRNLEGNEQQPSLQPPPFQLQATGEALPGMEQSGVSLEAGPIANAPVAGDPPPGDGVTQLQEKPESGEGGEQQDDKLAGFDPIGGVPTVAALTVSIKSGQAALTLVGPSGKMNIVTTCSLDPAMGEGDYQMGSHAQVDEFGGVVNSDPIRISFLAEQGPKASGLWVNLTRPGGKDEAAAMSSLVSYLLQTSLPCRVTILGIEAARAEDEEGQRSDPESESEGVVPDMEDYEFELADWFEILKKDVLEIDRDFKAKNEGEINLPDKLAFYRFRTEEAWKIQITEGGALDWVDVTKEQYDAAGDKSRFAEEVYDQILFKVSQMNKSERVREEESKGSDTRQGGSPDGLMPYWLRQLRLNLKNTLKHQRGLKENEGKDDFPDGLKVEYSSGRYYFKVLLEEVIEADPYERIDHEDMDQHYFKVGILNIPLYKGMENNADSLVGPVRELTALLRAGAGKTSSTGSTGDHTRLPAYPARIEQMDGNRNGVTTPGASNTFRMVMDYPAVHGQSRTAGVFGAASNTTYFEWALFGVPSTHLAYLDTLDTWEEKQQYLLVNQRQFEPQEGVGKHSTPDLDWDQSFDMYTTPGYYVVYCKAKPYYPEESKTSRDPSISRFFVHVREPEALGKEGVSTNVEEEVRLREESRKDPGNEGLREQLAELEAIENNEIGRREITSNKIGETEHILDTAVELQNFLATRRSNGSTGRDPVYLELARHENESLYPLWHLLSTRYPNQDPGYVLPDYIANLRKQKKDLEGLRARIDGVDDHFEKGGETINVQTQFVEKESGRTYPLIMLLGENSEKSGDKPHEYKLIDVTHPHGKPIVVIGEGDNREEAIRNAFYEFAGENNYGEGDFFYRIPPSGTVHRQESRTTVTTYLKYAAAAAGIAAMILGTVATGGLLAPATAAAVGAVATGLGIGSAVVSAGLAAKNIHDRVEKDTFAWDAELGLDIVDIAGAVVGLGGALQGLKAGATVARVGRVIRYMEMGEAGATAVFVGLKVREDLLRLEGLDLTDDEKRALQMQIALEAAQAGLMVAVSGAGTVGSASRAHGEAVAARDASADSFFKRKGWLDDDGNLTNSAPPFLKRSYTPETPDARIPKSDTPAPKPDADTPAPKPDADTPAPKPDADTPAPKPDADTPAPKPDADTPALKPDTDTPAPKPDTDTPALKPDAPTAPDPAKVKQDAVDDLAKREQNIEWYIQFIERGKSRIQRRRFELWTRLDNIQAEIKRLDADLALPRGEYRHGQKKKWKKERSDLIRERNQINQELDDLRNKRIDLDSQYSNVSQLRDELAEARANFVSGYPEHITNEYEHEFVARNVIESHLNATDWVKHPELIIHLPNGKTEVIIPDYVALINGDYVVIDAKFSQKILSAKPAAIMNTCTVSQKPSYGAISRGKATVEVSRGGTEGNLQLPVGKQIAMKPEVLFITNGVQPGTMDVIPLRNGSAGAPTKGLSAAKP